MTHEEMESLTATTKPVSALCRRPWEGGKWGESAQRSGSSFLRPPASACPLTHPFSPLFPLTGQETKEISWEQVGGAGRDVGA